MTVNYYTVLGASPNDPPKIIHERYRALALSLHPEKKQVKPDLAKTRFLQVAEAYDVLRDPFLRELYDQLGHDGLTSKFNAIPNYPYGYRYHGDPMRTYEEHFGTTSPYANAYYPRDMANEYSLLEDIFRARPKDVLPRNYVELEVTLEELFHGNIREIEFSRLMFKEESNAVTEERVVKEIHVLPGWGTNIQIVFEREGSQAKDKIPSDVVVQIVEAPHDRFVREGNDLRMKIEVDLLVALCGGDITVTSIDDIPIRIEETNVIKPGSTRMVPSFGMPLPDDNTARGNLYLDYDVIFPQDMDLARRELVASALKYRQHRPTIPTTLIGVTGFNLEKDLSALMLAKVPPAPIQPPEPIQPKSSLDVPKNLFITESINLQLLEFE